MKKSLLRVLEGFSWLAGVVLCAMFVSHIAFGEAERRDDLRAVELVYDNPEPDMSLWSEERIAAFDASRRRVEAEIAAVLSMPELDLEVPVYTGATDELMDLGAGLIAGTARPGEQGNIGIAGHRDGYFRVLKDVQPGQQLTLRTATGEQQFRVTGTRIVDPIDVEVLDPTPRETVTLVTCYPFYYVGSAPQRFIVTAELDINAVNQ